MILRDKKTNKVVAEADYETTKGGTKVSVVVPFPRPNILDIIYKSTIIPTIAMGTYFIVSAISKSRPIK
jgi:hypothetical protein